MGDLNMYGTKLKKFDRLVLCTAIKDGDGGEDAAADFPEDRGVGSEDGDRGVDNVTAPWRIMMVAGIIVVRPQRIASMKIRHWANVRCKYWAFVQTFLSPLSTPMTGNKAGASTCRVRGKHKRYTGYLIV
jgi:hypothetical protein